MATSGVVPDLQAGYELCQTKFYEFLDQYMLPEVNVSMSTMTGETSANAATSQASGDPVPHYVGLLEQMRLAQQTTLWIDWHHVREHDCDLADFIADFYYRMELRLRKAVQNLVREHMESYSFNEEDQSDREFWVAFYNLSQPVKLRQLKTADLGKLRSFSGTVTRTSEVRPELYLGTFECMECRTVVRDVAQQFKWTTPLICANQTCGNRRKWELKRDDCKFVNWQKVKVQESSDEVPAGSLPRNMEVIMRNDSVERCRAGDTMLFIGTPIVVPDVAAITAPGERVTTKQGRTPNGFAAGGQGVTGLKSLGCRELNYRYAFLACATQEEDANAGQVSVRSHDDATVDEVYDSYSDDQQNDLDLMKTNGDIYKDLTRSIAPQVYGHDDIKRAVLLMLFGGVHKQTKEGINLRGDINIAIVGDPSCAKSQILKYVSKFLPRAVYTSGKSSSAAGLTASVTKDTDTGEFCIEAGALMLADNGICCIDEFDKMDTKDQVAIHEAMEQQTISIAKAGIQASLNARTSILAAANPIGGRYDKSKPLKYNVGLPPAILSRFDLMHIMIDEPDEEMDTAVAKHIVGVHQQRERAFNVPYTMGQVQRYIKYARAIMPRMTSQAKKVLVESYKQLRTGDAAPGSRSAYRITVRQLEALVRLSEAHARVRCDEWIQPRDVREAKRLVRNSILSVETTDTQVDEVDFVDDAADVEDFVRSHRDGDDASGSGAQQGAGSRQGGAAASQGRAGASPPAGAAQPAAGTLRQSRSTGDNNAGQGADAPAEGAQEQPPRQGTRVSQKKVDQVRTLLVSRLNDEEEEKKKQQAESSAAAAEPGTIGTSQHDLLTWYFDHMITAKAFSKTEEVSAEFVLVSKIIHHLIRKDNALIVIDTPSRNEGESLEMFNKRQQRERILAVNPNYAAE